MRIFFSLMAVVMLGLSIANFYAGRPFNIFFGCVSLVAAATCAFIAFKLKGWG